MRFIRMMRIGFKSDACLGDYSRRLKQAIWCNLKDAWDVHDKMSSRDGVSWIAMITVYTKFGHANETLKLYHQMQLACEL